MASPRLQFRLSELFAFTGLLCLAIGTYRAAEKLGSQEHPAGLAAILLGFLSIGASGATVGTLFRRPMECAVIAYFVVPLLFLLFAAAGLQGLVGLGTISAAVVFVAYVIWKAGSRGL